MAMTSIELRDLRHRLGLRQADMAERIGMRPRAYHDLEVGVTPPRPTHEAAVQIVAMREAVDRRDPDLVGGDIAALARAFAALEHRHEKGPPA